jgi:hypothetical protein
MRGQTDLFDVVLTSHPAIVSGGFREDRMKSWLSPSFWDLHGWFFRYSCRRIEGL